MKTRKQLTYTLLIIFGIIILINVIAISLHYRLDTTKDKEYTLSKATKNILKNLNEPVTITAYFTKNLPPQYSKVRKEFKDLVSEYSSVSKGKVVFNFVNPNESNDLEQEAINDGIRPVLINVRAKDKIEQQKAYLGASIKVGNNKEIIPVIQDKTPLEYTLSTCIKKLTVTNKQSIGFLTGHGEIPLQNLVQALNDINILYNVMPVSMPDSLIDSLNLSQYKTLIIVAPKQPYSFEDLAALDNYLANGGKLMINLDHVNADLQQSMQLTISNSGLENWLADKGLVIKDNVIIDKHCGNIGVVQQQGQFSMTIPMAFPYLPIIVNFADHPISESLKGVSMTFASSMQYTGKGNIVFTPLLLSSESSGEIPLPATIDIQRKWTDGDFPSQNLTLGGIMTGNFNNGPQTSIIVIGDGDYAAGQGNQRVNADNINLLSNSIDWLSDDTGLIELRSKGIVYRPIDELSDSKRATIEWVNFLLPILLIIGYGIFNWQKRKIKRNKRMEENYVQ